MENIVAALQMASSGDIAKNVEKACQFIEVASSKGAQLVVLPEYFAHLGVNPKETLKIAEKYNDGPIQTALKNAAIKNKIWLIGGTIPLVSNIKDKVFSSCMMWDPRGDCVARYNKIHLFDVIVDTKLDKEEYRESDIIAPGNSIEVIDTPVGKIGFAICYDLRFPELFRHLMLKGAQMMVLPSAFTIPTGKAHWETLIRARAIENLCYVIAPGEVGIRANGIGTYGHSMIVGPWGEILASQDEGEGVVLAKIDLAKMNQIRKQFPVLTHIKIQEVLS